MMQSSRTLSSLSPSFNSYSSGRLTEIAARVVEEFRAESANDYYDEYGDSLNEEESDFSVVDVAKNKQEGEREEEEEDDDEFEFAVVARDFTPSPTSVDENFYNGQNLPYYPLFKTDLVFGHIDENRGNRVGYQEGGAGAPPPSSTARQSLRNLFIEDREHGSSSSCSSSEAADDLDGVQPDSYCVWNPKMGTQERRKKSRSTGSSKRWRLSNLSRSISDRKGSFALFHHSSNHSRDEKEMQENPVKVEKSSAVAPEAIPSTTSSLEKDVDRRRTTSSPYRPDLV